MRGFMFVKYSTIKKSVPGALSYPNQSFTCSVGKHKVSVTRASKLDRHGNPVYTANVLGSRGNVISSHRTNGNCHTAVSGALKKAGIKTKY